MIQPVKYYQAESYTILADSMEALDEENQEDWVILQMYIDLLSKLEFMEDYPLYKRFIK
jgi:hypothetical protein